MVIMRSLIATAVLCLCGVALAQSSASYRLESCAVNAGGHPRGGVILTSDSYAMSLDALGETLRAPLLRSTAYSMDVGIARSYPPPGEVEGVVLLGDRVTLAWNPERSVGVYHVYRGRVEWLPGSYGSCHIAEVPVQEVPVPGNPAIGRAFFYLVNARSRLFEEGTAGHDSAGGARDIAGPCP
jgi:hypothetical protein